MIFLMSCCVVAAVAANMAVVAPTIRQAVFSIRLLWNAGYRRINRNTPATTIVLE